ncbi:nitrate- and nitrite sensing domain-containing protein [Nonomuraea sp. NPDC003709]|uniref:sensor histidine kinase n=1 Tax=Nonomuraea sp. NPDC003709 TaxID=3154450 RepID=UPI0033AE5A61
MTKQPTARRPRPRLAHVRRRQKRRLRLRDWRVRARLVALILIPTGVGVVLGAQQVITSWAAAGQYQRVLEKAELGDTVIELTHQLARERDLAVYFVATGRSAARAEPLRRQFAPVDEAVAAVRAKAQAITPDHGESAWTITQQMISRLPEIPATRGIVQSTQLLALPALTKYSQIINAFQQFHDQISQGGDQEALGNSVRALAALSKAHDAASQQRGLLAAVASAGRFQSGELERFMAARAQQESEIAVFRSVATLDQLQTYDDIVTGTLVDRAEAIRLRALAQVTEGGRVDLDPGREDDAERWFEAISGTVDGMWTVQRRLGESINVQSRTLQDSARRDALLAATYSLLLLLAVLMVTAIMAQSLVRPLRRLRTEALHIAGVRLPRTVRSLHEAGDETTVAIPPIGVDSLDEVGEVARAFDEVHREAVRLAGEESRLRANVNAMFVSLSRRSQTLVQRQIKLIDGLERGEQDEQRLASLFTLDHLATRMRRNNENLLLLAGQEPPRRWNKPVSVADVVRACLSEVENYERVTPRVATRSAVSGQAVNDIIHLLAELVENALSFSPQTTSVVVTAAAIEGGGAVLSISDSGIGMVPDELAQANERLSNVPTVDVSVSRRMGLFVVARLAHRHGIRVQLHLNDSKGLTATVFLPEALLQPPAQSTPAASFGRPFDISDSWVTPPPPVVPSPRPYSPAVGTGSADWPSFATDPGPDKSSADWSADSIWPGMFDTPGARARFDLLRGGPGPVPGGPSFGGPVPDSPAFGGPIPGPVPGSPAFGGAAPGPIASGPIANGPVPDGSVPARAISVDPLGTGLGVAPVPDPDGYLPIFAAVTSAWFNHDTSDGAWSSPQADAGWSAAEAAASPANDGTTASGLPKRVPKANLVPGSADNPSVPKGVAPIPQISPEQVRDRMASYQQGFRAARDDICMRSIPPFDAGSTTREEGP